MAHAVELHIHPDPVTTILPHFLPSYLPGSLTLSYIVSHAYATRSLVLAPFSPSSAPPENAPWSTAALDPAEPDATRTWFWTSAADDDAHGGEHLAAALRRAATLRPELQSVKIGALHAPLARSIPRAATLYLTTWAQLAFSRPHLPPPSAALERAYAFRPLDEDGLDDVLAGSVIPRTRASLQAMPSNTAAHDRVSGRAVAWAFTLRQGSVGLVFVREEYRGKGLGREVMAREARRACEEEGKEWVLAEVHEKNVESLAVCRACGAARIGEVVWIEVTLDAYREKNVE
ncbi:hypothetical protein K488DRAFT_60600 [Vararia minispora EC-137]|uniref:Uncharacterized protein n=1 Tax=Vararia minispora EC-137 TaxID=1314806 RepID=A0ACB8Q7P0_9AGAM|nr:hypothetical protein K488DRAFT_60600 [Vararia minispora EC-137]